LRAAAPNPPLNQFFGPLIFIENDEEDLPPVEEVPDTKDGFLES
jgi:hypothetical protein